MLCRMRKCPQLLPVLSSRLLGKMTTAYKEARLWQAREALEEAVGCRMCHEIGHSYDPLLAQASPCLSSFQTPSCAYRSTTAVLPWLGGAAAKSV